MTITADRQPNCDSVPCRQFDPANRTCKAGKTPGCVVPKDCRGCATYDPVLRDDERTVCEIWSRVMGYHRPISSWNAGKQAEYAERVTFNEPTR